MKTRTMKVLDEASLLFFAKTDLEEVTTMDLQRGMYDNVSVLSECKNLRNLFLARNNLTSFKVDCRKLWKIDLSHNSLTSVGSLANFAAIGFLDLSFNDLDAKELAKLRGVHIVSLRTAANPKLSQLPNYRTALIYLLPDVWVIDDEFVSWREREEAQMRFSSAAAQNSPICQLAADAAGDVVWRSTADVEDHVHKFLHSLTQEPMRPTLRDRFRLKRLLHVFEEQYVSEEAFLESSHSKGSGYKGRGKSADHRRTSAGVVRDQAPSSTDAHIGSFDKWSSLETQSKMARDFLKWTPQTHTTVVGLRKLHSREQIDLILLLNSVYEFGVPRSLVEQALTVHFGNKLLANVLKDLARHPECIFRANTYHVRFSNIEARDAAVGQANSRSSKEQASVDPANKELIEDLWKAVDEHEGIQTHLQSSKRRSAHRSSSFARQRATHAAILLSRAPSFPSPLLCTVQSKTDEALEAALQPLLHAAGMTTDDLTFAGGAPARPDSPPIHLYKTVVPDSNPESDSKPDELSPTESSGNKTEPADEAPPAGVFLTGDGVEVDANEEDFSELDQLPVEFFQQPVDAPPPDHRTVPSSSVIPTSPRQLASVKLAPSVSGQEGRSTNCLYVKQPVMGEPVEIGYLARNQPRRVMARIKRTDETSLYLLSKDKLAAKVCGASFLRDCLIGSMYLTRFVFPVTIVCMCFAPVLSRGRPPSVQR